jgi:hypothetical protein
VELLQSWLQEAEALLETLAGAQNRPAQVALLILLLLGGLAAASLVVANRRLADVARAVGDSTRGRFRPTQRRVGLLRGDILPAPDPFSAFSIELMVRGPTGALPVLGSQRFLLTGQLARRPTAELVWQRGRTPERALGRGPETRLWVLRRLEVAPGEFAVHGGNPAALEHAFFDLQARFGAFTRRVSILAEAQPHFEMVLEANGLTVEEIPALITTVRMLARAAQRS